jgi:hypothetical protein
MSKKKASIKKLKLARETLKALTRDQLAQAAGGDTRWSNGRTYCPTMVRIC